MKRDPFKKAGRCFSKDRYPVVLVDDPRELGGPPFNQGKRGRDDYGARDMAVFGEGLEMKVEEVIDGYGYLECLSDLFDLRLILGIIMEYFK